MKNCFGVRNSVISGLELKTELILVERAIFLQVNFMTSFDNMKKLGLYN